MASTPSTVFDDAALYQALRSEVVPLLKTWPFVRVWQLGLAVPEDPWATAILLREEGVFERSIVYATDPDPTRVAAAERGEFPRSHYSTAQAPYTAGGGRAILEEYFSVSGTTVRMRDLLRDKIVFSEHDPRCEASFNEFQLALCRPGWSRDEESRVVGVLEQSLCRFGVVGFIGHDAPRALSRVTGYEAVMPRLLRKVR